MRGHVDQLVDRCVRNAEAARSNPVSFSFEEEKNKSGYKEKNQRPRLRRGAKLPRTDENRAVSICFSNSRFLSLSRSRRQSRTSGFRQDNMYNRPARCYQPRQTKASRASEHPLL